MYRELFGKPSDYHQNTIITYETKYKNTMYNLGNLVMLLKNITHN